VETTAHLPCPHFVLLVLLVAIVEPETTVPPFLAQLTLHHRLL
jgi:hypothetical protein